MPTDTVSHARKPGSYAPPTAKLIRRIGPAILRWRQAAGCSREMVCSIVHRSLSTLVRWETGRATPRLEDVLAMEGHRPGLVALLLGKSTSLDT